MKYHFRSLSVLFCALVALVAGAPQVTADALQRGQVIVQYEPGRQVIREITFAEDITGLQALKASGLEVVTQNYAWGEAVCSIGGVGCPADNCFCDSAYWGYSQLDTGSGAWIESAVGASSSTVTGGGVEGWRWGEWGSGNLPAAQPLQAAQKALDWLQTKQSASDGGYGTRSSSIETLLALAANELPAAGWRAEAGAPSLAGYILANAAAYANGGAAAGKQAAALAGADLCLPFGARTPTDFYQNGVYQDGSGSQAWGMLGVAALGETVPQAAIDALLASQQSNGGWEWGAGWGTDTNSTALAIQALVAAGVAPSDSAIQNGLAYLKTAQNSDGGFPYDPVSPYGTGSDANSTAYVIQAIQAAGQDPAGSAWTVTTNTPVAYLLSLQLADGSFEWQAGLGSNLSATQQAIPALLGRGQPALSAALTACPAVFLPDIARE